MHENCYEVGNMVFREQGDKTGRKNVYGEKQSTQKEQEVVFKGD